MTRSIPVHVTCMLLLLGCSAGNTSPSCDALTQAKSELIAAVLRQRPAEPGRSLLQINHVCSLRISGKPWPVVDLRELADGEERQSETLVLDEQLETRFRLRGSPGYCRDDTLYFVGSTRLANSPNEDNVWHFGDGQGTPAAEDRDWAILAATLAADRQQPPVVPDSSRDIPAAGLESAHAALESALQQHGILTAPNIPVYLAHLCTLHAGGASYFVVATAEQIVPESDPPSEGAYPPPPRGSEALLVLDSSLKPSLHIEQPQAEPLYCAGSWLYWSGDIDTSSGIRASGRSTSGNALGVLADGNVVLRKIDGTQILEDARRDGLTR